MDLGSDMIILRPFGPLSFIPIALGLYRALAKTCNSNFHVLGGKCFVREERDIQQQLSNYPRHAAERYNSRESQG